MKNIVKNFLREESGQGLVEYVLLVALIALGAVAGMNTLATGIGAAFTKTSTTLASAV